MLGHKDLSAKVTVVEVSDFMAKVYVIPKVDLMAKVDIIPYKNLYAKVITGNWSSFSAKVNVTKPSEKDLSAKVNVLVGTQRLSAIVTVLNTIYSDLHAKIRLTGRLQAIVNVLQTGSMDLDAKVHVKYSSESDFWAKLFIPAYSSFAVKVRVLREGSSDFNAKIYTIADRPTDVVITANVPEAVWTPESDIIFQWTESYDEYFSVLYYWQLNRTANYVVTESDINNGVVRTKERFFDESGHWYFHVRPRNSNGYFSPNTAHFHLMYNHQPTAPQPPLYVDGQSSPAAIFDYNPIFQWTNATDPDPIDVLTYRLQIATDSGFTNIVTDVLNIVSGSTVTTYKLTELQKVGRGVYYWRAFAFDGNEYGPASSTMIFETVPTDSDFNAKITVGTLKSVNVSAKVTVIPYKNLPAKITITAENSKDLLARITVKYADDSQVWAKLTVPRYEFLGAKINVITYMNLFAKLKVIDVPGFKDLNARIIVGRYDDSALNAKLKIGIAGYDSLQAIINIIGVDSKDLSAKINVFITTLDLMAKVKVIRLGDKDLMAKITTVYSYPGAIVLYCNVIEAMWQDNNDILFTWLPATPGLNDIAGYRFQLDHNASTAYDVSWFSTIVLTQGFDLENYTGAGSYWFHICAIDSIGRTGPVTHFNVLYNHRPGPPQIPMTINGVDSITDTPIVAKTAPQLFAWVNAYDPDPIDVQQYKIEISSDIYFINIVKTVSGIIGTSYELTLGNKLPQGFYYWRVISFDGHEWGSWSQVGRFYINTPPTVPTDLQVIGA